MFQFHIIYKLNILSISWHLFRQMIITQWQTKVGSFLKNIYQLIYILI